MVSGWHLRATATVAALALSLSAGAAESSGAADEARRQPTELKMKERAIEYIDARIRILQATRVCVRAAADMEAMSMCYAQERRQMKDLRDKERQDIRDGSR